MALEKQIAFRVSDNEYKRIEKYKELRNKQSTKKLGYREIFMEKIDDDMAKGNIGLEFKRNELLTKYDELKATKNSIVSDMEEIEIQLNKLDTELNNSTLYDLANYRHNTNIVKAVNSVKAYCLHNGIAKPDYIPSEVLKELELTFKIKDGNLFKNIVFTEFENWEEEITESKPETNNNKAKLFKIAVNVLAKFKNKDQPIKDLSEYLETNKETIIKLIPNNCTFDDLKKEVIELNEK